MNIDRRTFVKAAGALAAVGITGAPSLAFGAGKKVVVVGGGTGGATAAKYIKKLTDKDGDKGLAALFAYYASQQ